MQEDAAVEKSKLEEEIAELENTIDTVSSLRYLQTSEVPA